MSSTTDSPDFEQYRGYLRLLARARLAPELRRKVDASDIVQQTIVEAHAGANEFRGETEAERLAWLRRILNNNLANLARDWRAAKRDLRREVFFSPGAADETAERVDDWLAASQSTPSAGVHGAERRLRLARAIAELSDELQEAIVLRFIEGQTIESVANHLSVTRKTASGYLRRAVAALRESFGGSLTGDDVSPGDDA